MREKIYRSYCLKGTELAVLLCAANINEVQAFPFVDGSETDEDYLYSVNDLANKGVVVRSGDKLVIAPPYDEMMSVIAAHSSVMTVRSYCDGVGDQCVYYDKNNQKMLMVSISKRRKHSLLLTDIEVDTFIREHIIEGILPEKAEPIHDIDSMDKSDIGVIVDTVKNKKSIDDVRVLLSVSIISRSTKREVLLMVLNMPEGLCIARCSKTECVVLSYVREQFVDELLKEIKGDDEWLL